MIERMAKQRPFCPVLICFSICNPSVNLRNQTPCEYPKQNFLVLSPSTHDPGYSCIVVTTEPFDDFVVICFSLYEYFDVLFIPMNGGSCKDGNGDPVHRSDDPVNNLVTSICLTIKCEIDDSPVE